MIVDPSPSSGKLIKEPSQGSDGFSIRLHHKCFISPHE
nr:MAG TPA: hypothetical protein [Caudoviricetes sp.]